MNKLQEDLNFWKEAEQDIIKLFEDIKWVVKANSNTDILDFEIIDSNWNQVFIELKTRRNNKLDYPDTMIWLNKLIEVFKRYEDTWIYTLFFFKFEDWLYFVNPFYALPRFEYRKGRYDRWDLDKVRGWIFYRNEDLIKFSW